MNVGGIVVTAIRKLEIPQLSKLAALFKWEIPNLIANDVFAVCTFVSETF